MSDACAAGCNAAELRCADVVPSNNLASFLALASSQKDLDLGDSATINTDTGRVAIDGTSIDVNSGTLDQTGAPTIRVLLVRSLTAKKVEVTGTNALAVVSDGDININGVFAASAHDATPGAGALDEARCQGAPQVVGPNGKTVSGAGGGGFGSVGGDGGSGKRVDDFAPAQKGGQTTGNASLIPLRGGCRGGGAFFGGGRGGGAIQLVSRTQILIADNGGVATNGGARGGCGGGSGGGILLEAPVVQVADKGFVVANGAGGMGSLMGQDGQLSATPALGSNINFRQDYNAQEGAGGNGGARNSEATNGQSLDEGTLAVIPWAGHAGGGAGRIRVNTIPDGLKQGGVFSPVPSTGPLATR